MKSYNNAFKGVDGEVRLATVNTDTHMNVIVDRKPEAPGRTYGGVTLNKPQALALRDALIEAYPKPRGIVKGRDRAVRLFVKSDERSRILQNAQHYAETSDANSGFVMGLDKFIDGGYRDYDGPEIPLGRDEHKASEELIEALRNKKNKCLPKLSEEAEALFRKKRVPWNILQAQTNLSTAYFLSAATHSE
jgi:hypothetical protein